MSRQTRQTWPEKSSREGGLSPGPGLSLGNNSFLAGTFHFLFLSPAVFLVEGRVHCLRLATATVPGGCTQ